MREERFVKDEEYKELRPANAYDVAANETWLEDMAKQGYRLARMTGWSGVFRETELFSCRYRMQPLSKREKRPPEETAEAYRELGWEYAGTIPGAFHVWRCEDPDAPELDTDPVVQGMGYGYLKRRMLRDSVLCGLLAAAVFALWALIPAAFESPVLDMVETYAPGRLLAGTAASVLLLVLLFCQVRSMRRLLRSLNAGIPLDRPRPYRRQKWLARGLMAALICMYAVSILGGLRNNSGGSLAGGWHAYDAHGVPAPEVVYVDPRVLEETVGDPLYMDVRTKVHELAPRIFWATEAVALPDGGQAVAGTACYRLLTAGLARRLAEELTVSDPAVVSLPREASPDGTSTPVETEELDGFWWWLSDEDTQCAVARLGRQVLFVRYRGAADLRGEAAYLASLLT